MNTFNKALERVLAAEGHFSNDPQDPGNWTTGKVGHGYKKGTKYGISAASYPNLDIYNLTLQQATDIYYLDYWKKLSLPYIETTTSPLVADMLFNLGVNCGPGNAAKFLQRTINALVIQENMRIEPRRLSAWQQKVLRIISNKALKVDGIVGSITTSILHEIPHHRALAAGIFGEAYNHYKAGKVIYRAGWFNRLGFTYLPLKAGER